MDSFTRYARRPAAVAPSTVGSVARHAFAAVVFGGVFILAHLDLILWS